jgi:hypothetical protein
MVRYRTREPALIGSRTSTYRPFRSGSGLWAFGRLTVLTYQLLHCTLPGE